MGGTGAANGKGKSLMLCITMPRPGPRVLAVVIIVIYLLTQRLTWGNGAPLTLVSALCGLPSARPKRECIQ